MDASNADTTMFYDKNGTIIVDLDRNICAIRNNLLNLPDTVQFTNGNQIINSYDAMGRKRSTIYRTLTTPIVVPVGSVVNLPSNNYTTRTIYYSGNLKIDNTPSNGTIFVLNTSDGYFQTDDLAGYRHHCYYVRDHLGNVCAVWDSYASSFTQTTFYYPSGVPMSISTNQAVQPNKYNGKPYEEMHGMDVYEYEFRNYYATIMRFTAMDPLCEQTPWQSPYVYAANNPVCNVDWMGLGAWGFGSAYGGYQMTILDQNYNVLFHDDSGGIGVYIYLGEDFDEKTYNKSDLLLIGLELPYVRYKKGQPCLYLGFSAAGGGGDYLYGEPIYSPVIYYGSFPATSIEIMNWLRDIPQSKLLSTIEYVTGFTNDLMKEPYRTFIKRAGIAVSALNIVSDIGDIIRGENNLNASENIIVEALAISSAVSGNPLLLAAALLVDIYYTEIITTAEKLSMQFTAMENYDNLKNRWSYYYGY